MLSIKLLAETSVERAQRDKDLAIVVTGAEGDGKSALSLGIGYAIDPLFDLDRNVLFSPTVQTIKDKIYNLPPYSVIDADEAIKILYKLNWQSKGQKFLNTVYTLCRNQNKISLFNIPRLTDANEYFRNHRLKIWIHIVDPISNQKKEGHAVLMSKSWNPVTIDPWGLKVFEAKMTKERKHGKQDVHYTLDDKIALFSELPSFVDVIKFKWVDAKIWAEYNRLKDLNSIKDQDVLEDDKTVLELAKVNKRVVLCVKIFMKMGYKKAKIARLFKVHVQTVTNWLKKFEEEKEIKILNEPKI